MKYLILIIKLFLSLAITIIIPSSHAVSVLAFRGNRTIDSFQENGLFILIATFFIDTIYAIPLGTTAFTWLILVPTFLSLQFAVKTIYHSHQSLINFMGDLLFISLAVLSHQWLIDLFVGVKYQPTLQEVLSVILTYCVISWLVPKAKI